MESKVYREDLLSCQEDLGHHQCERRNAIERIQSSLGKQVLLFSVSEKL
jgi:hypothetical protein